MIWFEYYCIVLLYKCMGYSIVPHLIASCLDGLCIDLCMDVETVRHTEMQNLFVGNLLDLVKPGH